MTEGTNEKDYFAEVACSRHYSQMWRLRVRVGNVRKEQKFDNRISNRIKGLDINMRAIFMM